MPQSFQPYPEEGADTQGHFNLVKFLHDTMTMAPIHFMAIVPHILIPLYGLYRVLKQSGYWTPQVDYAIDGLLVPLLQGLALGGVLGTGTIRFITPSGRKVANKRKEDAATDSEGTSQHRIEIAFYSFLYLGFATLLWQRFPVAEGPGIAAFQRLAGRVGVDLGSWTQRKH